MTIAQSVVLLVVMITTCDNLDQLSAHDCDVAAGLMSKDVDVELRHTQPEKCPILLGGNYPGPILTSGEFVEVSAPPEQLSTMVLTVRNQPQGVTVASSDSDFRLDSGEWIARPAVYYSPASGSYWSDNAHFTPYYLDGSGPDPDWVMYITYVPVL